MRAGGATDGGSGWLPLVKAQPSTDPCFGRDPEAPIGLYVHDPPRLAVQYDQ